MSVRSGKGSSSLIAGVLLLTSWRSGQVYTRIGPTTLLCATTCRRDCHSLPRHITTCTTSSLEFFHQVCADPLFRLRSFPEGSYGQLFQVRRVSFPTHSAQGSDDVGIRPHELEGSFI